MIIRFFKLLFSLFPDLTGFKELGFEVKTHNGELFVQKNTSAYTVKFSQGYEPFSPHIKVDIDFDIPDGFFFVEFKEKVPPINNFKSDLEPLFRHQYQRGKCWIIFDNKLDFSSPQIGVRAEKLIEIIEKSLGD